MSDRSELISTGEPFVFDDERDAEFERLIVRYPIRESMIMPALWMAQEQQGWISTEAIEYIAVSEGYSLVLEKQNPFILHYGLDIDITDKVLKYLLDQASRP